MFRERSELPAGEFKDEPKRKKNAMMKTHSIGGYPLYILPLL
jgi:hypothetical protein